MNLRTTKNRNKGFTLVELSIVIVLIGLIVAGVVGAQSLIKQAKLRSITSDMSNLKTAMNSFKLQYNAYPGDISNIQSYYPTIQNGNGNRVMNGNTHEHQGFWEVLQVEGLYTKYIEGPNPEFQYTNQVTPYGKGALYRTISGTIYQGRPSWYMQLGDVSQFNRLRQVVETREAISMDEKHDDGLADSGWIKAGKNFDTLPMNGCVMGNQVYWNLTSATYNRADQTEKCLMFFNIE